MESVLVTSHYDYCIIGGGIVGLATALTLSERYPGARIVLLEKEPGLARHQTARRPWQWPTIIRANR
jgi:L-2-hydroxyglutarate oxidase LhgO